MILGHIGSTAIIVTHSLVYFILFCKIKKIPDNHRYFDYQKYMSGNPEKNPSHLVIQKAIDRLGKDFRYEDSEHPIKELRSRKVDNVKVARTKK